MSSMFPAPSSPFYSLPAYCASFIEKDIEDGDKLILHNSILESLLTHFNHRDLPDPLIFELHHSARVVHCGVLEFSAPQVAAFMPRWLMDNAGVKDGESIKIRLKTLPKATFVKFQPLSYSFTLIPQPKLALEYALRKFTALTVGDLIMIKYGVNTYYLNVLELLPTVTRPCAVCVVNTSLSVDFDSPIEGAEEEAVSVVQTGERIEKEIEGDKYQYYRYKPIDTALALRIRATGSPVPDVYISTKVECPEASQNIWKTDMKSKGEIIIQPHDIHYTQSWYYIAIHSYRVATKYSLVVEEIPATKGPSASSSSPVRGPANAPASPPDPSYKFCANCHQHISPGAYSLHSVQCPRLNFYCPTCRCVLKRADQAAHVHCSVCEAALVREEVDKHMDLFHRQVPCPLCGEQRAIGSLAAHQQSECVYRPCSCKYCELQLPAKQLADHEGHCGGKTIPCERCGADVARKRMNIHLAVEHKINPSFDPDSGYLTGKRVESVEKEREHEELKRKFLEDVEAARALKGSGGDAALDGDEALARALEASEADAAGEGNDYALQRALMESQALAAAQASRSPAPAPASASAFSPPADDDDFDADEPEYDDINEWDEQGGGDEDGQSSHGAHSQHSHGQGPSQSHSQPQSQPQQAKRTGDHACPYCGDQSDTYELLIAHMGVCEMADD